MIRNQVVNDLSENDCSDKVISFSEDIDEMISLTDLSYSDPNDPEWSLPQKRKVLKLFSSHQCQTGNKSNSTEDHYSSAHSAPKRRKNEFGLPQSVNLTKLPTSPCDIAPSERHKPGPGYYNSDTGPVTRLDLEHDIENIKDVSNKEQGVMILGDRERKFSDSSGSSPSTSVSSSSPKVRNNLCT